MTFKTCPLVRIVVMFLCSCGENVASKLFLFPSIYRHKLVPSAFICSNPGITILPRPHLGTKTCFAAYRGKISRVVFKTESARTSSSCWTKLCTKIIYTLLQAFVLLLQISYQKKSFLTTPNIENQSRSSAEFH